MAKKGSSLCEMGGGDNCERETVEEVFSSEEEDGGSLFLIRRVEH